MFIKFINIQELLNKEGRDIIYFNHYESHKVLPTHFVY